MFIFTLAAACGLATASASFAPQECNLPQELKEEIHGYRDIVDQIISAAVGGKYSGQLYDDIADFVDNYGNRLVGTENLEAAIDNAMDRMNHSGLKVSAESVIVPHWIRGEESAYMTSPRNVQLNMLALGFSPGTGPEGIESQILLVQDFDELNAKADQVPGKIVLFNAIFTTYGQTNQYRVRGPAEASRLGAVAALVRSVTPFSINSPHTGTTLFPSDVAAIPSAAITLEDADMIARLITSGKEVRVLLKMKAKNGPNKISRNVVGDITGETKSFEYVILSGHIDSWDVGQGALDDAGGAFLAWHSLALIKSLALPPAKRTLRAILWTGEEPGLIGAQSYLDKHEDELKNWTAAFESDNGVFQSFGLSFAGNEDATCIVLEILSLLGRINTTTLRASTSAGSDIDLFQPLGVPLGEPLMVENNYFWFHHSFGDSMATLDATDLDQNLAMFAATAYILGDISIQLPRGEETAAELLQEL